MIKKLSALYIKFSVLVTCITLLNCASAQINEISLTQITTDVSYLASDDLKGRDNFSPEIRYAAEYIAKRFKESGLQTSDNNSEKSYFQKYQVTRVIPQKISLAINGQNIINEDLAFASTVANFSWEKSNKAQQNNFKLHNISETDDAKSIISHINKEGGKHLVLLNPIHETLFKRYQHHFQRGTTRLTLNNINTHSDGVIVIALTTIMSPKIKTLNVTGINSINKEELINVVATLPGKTKPEEVILFSAHYDHLGINKGDGDIIFNGADDNASGTTAIMNLAQYYAARKDNDRTLMFAAFSAEELGGFGSSYFSKQLDPKEIIAMINIEMVGKASKFGAGTIWMTGIERSSLGAQLNTTLATSGHKIYTDPYPEQNLFYRSDNATLARLGVPAHTFSSVQLDNDQHYHQTSDDVSSLNLKSLHQVIKLLAIATQPLANGKITPSRVDKNLIKKKGLIF